MFELTFLNHRQHQQMTLVPGDYLIGSAPSTPGATGTPSTLSVVPEMAAPHSASSVANRFADANPAIKTIVINDPWVAADQMTLNLNHDGVARLYNVGRPILLPSGRRIKSQVVTELEIPTAFTIGKTRFSLQRSAQPWKHDDTLTTITRRVADQNAYADSLESQELSTQFLQSPPAADTLIQWFDALNQLQRSSAGSAEFYETAVHCLSDPGGLDLGLALVRNAERWEIAASHVPFPEAGFSFRRDLVDRVVREGRLWFHLGCDEMQVEPNTTAHWVVAAPVFGREQQVIAVLYGARFENAYNHRHGIRPLEAHFTRMIADTVSSATQRIEVEAEAARSHVLLEQTFSPPVVEILKRDPKLLHSRQCEVSVLFADLRQFSRISESIGPQTTHQLLADLLNQLTAIVEQHRGVVIDFYGDGLAAFWNAPVQIEDHPLLACQAALALQSQMVQINQTWQDQVGQPIQMGVGIHTGVAQVGNSGCHRKLKYGPRGNTVNLASRLESATKRFQVPILISAETAARVMDRMMTVRLCDTTLPGIRQTVGVCQLIGQELSLQTLKFIQSYGQALTAMESGQFQDSLDVLCELFLQNESDPRVNYLIGELEKIHAQNPAALSWPSTWTKSPSIHHHRAAPAP